MLNLRTIIVCLISFNLAQVTALPPISTKGAKFFVGGEQFFLKGVAYQGTPADPLIDVAQCRADAKLMQSIGCNSIRVYHVDPQANHDGCMKEFDDAGIYIWLDLETFNTAITESNPQWKNSQFLAYASVINNFHKYNNTGGFIIGNENIESKNGSFAAPYVKAAAADVKSYIDTKHYRKIPVGYTAADIAELRPMLQNYLVCGSKPEQAIDFFGLNSYEWCGAASYETSGYIWLQQMTRGYPVPIFFSETGCNVGGERIFNDQAAIFGPNMSETWSGAIVYEWVQEVNNYGLVTYQESKIYSGAPIPIQPGFNNLAAQWKAIKPPRVDESSYIPNLARPACPTPTNGWMVNGDVPLPTLNATILTGSLREPGNKRLPALAKVVPKSSTNSVVGPSVSMQATATPSMSVTSSSPQASNSLITIPLGPIIQSMVPHFHQPADVTLKNKDESTDAHKPSSTVSKSHSMRSLNISLQGGWSSGAGMLLIGALSLAVMAFL